MTPVNVLRRGRDEAAGERWELRAGPLAMEFEPATGFLRHVRLGDREVLRGVYGAVRGPLWVTAPPTVSNLAVERGPDSFRIDFDVECRQGAIDFVWHGTVTGGPDGAVRFAMAGRARSTFLRNRIGLCVLHPPRECAGRPCVVERADGAVERAAFPEEIAPHQPFLELRALTHEVEPGLSAEVRFEGDVFETEDQRNWTDDSFKTYSTPLRLPFPVEVKAGDEVVQAVTLTLRGAAPPARAAAPARPSVRPGGVALARLPALGLGVASHGRPLAPREVDLLRALRLHHLRVDLHAAAPGCLPALRQAAADARAVGAKLELALFLQDAGDGLDALSQELRDLRVPVAHWLVFGRDHQAAPGPLLERARQSLLPHTPGAKVGTGTNVYFTDLNRLRPPLKGADFVCYSVNPQVHAFDDLSLVETLEGQQATALAARRLAGGRPVAVTPVTLRPRFNVHTRDRQDVAPAGGLPSSVDVRQASLFAGAWTLGSVRRLAGAGVASITYYETTGWRGVLEVAEGPPLPEKFPSFPGAAFPAYHVLAGLADGPVDLAVCSHPREVEAIFFGGRGRRAALVANLTDRPQEVVLWPDEALSGQTYRVRCLDETTAEGAMRSPEEFRRRWSGVGPGPLRLLPYAVAHVEAE